MRRSTTQHSRKLSWLLRHGAGEVGLAMDEAGWVHVDAVLDALGLTHAELLSAVRLNDKGRLQLRGDHVRACQGHSLRGMPVTQTALEASWQIVTPTRSLWHGTNVAAAEGIAARGIQAGRRSHVHLAPDRDSRVGKRVHVDLLLEISPALLAQHDIAVFAAPNGVLLARQVPRACIVTVHPVSRHGRQAGAVLRFG